MDKDSLYELFQKYRLGKVKIQDLSEEQVGVLSKLYDKQIREIAASNRSPKMAPHAEVDSGKLEYDIEDKVRDMLLTTTFVHSGKTMDKFYLKENPSGLGLDLYESINYLATYSSFSECICDLSFHYDVVDFDTIKNMFARKGEIVAGPYKYRGVCSELFHPLDKVSRYVYYSNSLLNLFEKFSLIEERSFRNPSYFTFGVQGTGIHLFNEDRLKYDYWIGRPEMHAVSDVINQAHSENKFIPSEVMHELSELNKVDVFISHKSDDFVVCKKIYDYYMANGISTFLSEMTLPALSNSDYSAEIDKALENAKNIVIVATSRENVLSGWVKYEWSTFANEKRSGRKTGNIITLIGPGMNIAELPILLRQFEVLELDSFKLATKYLELA